MYNSSSDSDKYFTGTKKIESYLRLPSPHEQIGGALYQDEDMPAEENTLPTLNASQPEDYEGSPVSSDQYIDIPLSPEFADLISIKIKRTAFVRQKVRSIKAFSFWPVWVGLEHLQVHMMFLFQEWSLDDHLFRCIFVPKQKAKNHVLLLSALLGAIHEVIAWTMTLFKNYYTKRSPEPDTQAYLKITERHLERGINVGHFGLADTEPLELADVASR